MYMNRVERRKMERFPLKLEASLSVEDGEGSPVIINLTTENISSAGAYLTSGAELPVGTDVDIDLVLPVARLKKMSGKSSHVKITGAIIRSGKDGMAILFNKRYKILPY